MFWLILLMVLTYFFGLSWKLILAVFVAWLITSLIKFLLVMWDEDAFDGSRFF